MHILQSSQSSSWFSAHAARSSFQKTNDPCWSFLQWCTQWTSAYIVPTNTLTQTEREKEMQKGYSRKGNAVTPVFRRSIDRFWTGWMNIHGLITFLDNINSYIRGPAHTLYVHSLFVRQLMRLRGKWLHFTSKPPNHRATVCLCVHVRFCESLMRRDSPTLTQTSLNLVHFSAFSIYNASVEISLFQNGQWSLSFSLPTSPSLCTHTGTHTCLLSCSFWW